MTAKMTHAGTLALAVSLLAAPALAQGTGTGPVARACEADIKTYCAGLEHGQGEVRACLEENKDKVSDACKEALETTGHGRRS